MVFTTYTKHKISFILKNIVPQIGKLKKGKNRNSLVDANK